MSPARRDLAAILRCYADLGVETIDAPRPAERGRGVAAAAPAAPSRGQAAPNRQTDRPESRASRGAPPREPAGGRSSATPRSSSPGTPLPEPPIPFASLDEMAVHLHDCARCPLQARRTQVVFGTGNPSARLMFIGEGPGEDEDLQGIPFVGRAGVLLEDIIRKGMGLERSEVYIANVVKCRPPGNRNPEGAEVAACSPFLREQVRLVAPEIIVTLGKFAAHTLLGVDTPISRLRGQWREYEGIPLMPTFHPSYLLRPPDQVEKKKLVWEDIKQVMARLGLERPGR